MLLILATSVLLSGWLSNFQTCYSFSIREAKIQDLQTAFRQNHLTSKQLVEFYLSEITRLNPLLKGVLEVNPDAVLQAKKADEERRAKKPGSLSGLHGIPILLKDNIATKDKFNTTAGSFALLGSIVPRDAGVAQKKASLSEWAYYRSSVAPSGWCARGGQGKNPYVLSADPCGSSSGSAISVAANMAAVSLGSETDGSILCPSSFNAVVGIKPTVGLTSRAGVVPITPRQDTIGEATIQDLHTAFQRKQLTSTQLVEFYLTEITRLNPLLKGVIEVNPDAILQAKKADEERRAKKPGSLSGLHGIPILLKDNIATKDKLNTTAGSFALLGSIVPRDAGVAQKLRKAGAIILGKASMTEWAAARSTPNGWCARGGQGKNPYVLSADPCGSSSGSAISVAANMAAVSLGSETDGSILCPSSFNAVVGIKPTVGLTSRAGVIPFSPRQDTIGPICRTVSDAVCVLDAIVGFDPRDAKATRKASKYIPHGGYAQFLKSNGLKGKRLGIVRNPFFNFDDKLVAQTFEHHFRTLRQEGAVLVDNLEIAHIDTIFFGGSEGKAVDAEFKMSLNAYLEELVASRVRSLADIIAFNEKYSDLEMIKQYGQDTFLAAEATNGIGKTEKEALKNLTRLSKNGLVKLMNTNKLDAVVAGKPDVSVVLAIGGFPGISVPAAYDSKGVPIGMCFGGLKGSEPTLIEIAYGFEQATKIRKPPTFLP